MEVASSQCTMHLDYTACSERVEALEFAAESDRCFVAVVRADVDASDQCMLEILK